MPRLWRRLVAVTIAAVLVFAAFSVYADVRQLSERLGQVRPLAVLAALALAAANYVLRFQRWQLYLRRADAVAPRRASALVFVSGFVMSVTPGKLGELFKAVLLREVAGVPAARTAPVVIAERVTDLVALVLLGLAGVAAYGIAASTVLAAAAVVAAGLAVLAYRPLADALLGAVGRVPRLGRVAPRLREAYDNLADLIRPAPLAWATGLGVLAWLCECIGFAVITRSLPGAHVPLGLAVLIYAATTVAGALSFLPGGLVVTEASMVLLLVHSARGLDQPAAVAATLVTRLCTLWFAVGLGLVAYAWLRRAFPGTAPALGTDHAAPGPDEAGSYNP